MSPMLLNVILWITFALIIVFSLLAGLIGFLKGIYKTTLKTIIKTILILIFIFVTPSIANAIGNINFSNFNIHFVINNINITFTTIQQTLADVLTATGVITPLNGLSLYETAVAISNSALSYIVFFIICILIQLTSSLITAMIYNGIIKWFLPVENKQDIKNKKKDKNKYDLTNGIDTVETSDSQVVVNSKKKLKLFRLPSLFLGIAQEFVFLCILISPLTAFSRIAIKNDENISNILKFANVDDKYFNEYSEVIKKSPLYNMLGTLNFDSSINYRTTLVRVNGQYMTIDKLINSLFDISQPLIDGECISYDKALGNVTYNLSYLLSKTMVSTLIEKVLLNNVLVALIPPAIDIGLNSISNPQFAIPKIDFDNINWNNELQLINEIYSKVYDKGIVSSFIADDNKKFTVDNFLIECGKLTDADINSYSEITSKFASLDLVKNNIGKFLASVGSLLSSSGLEILPSEESAYINVDFEGDISIFTTNLFKVFRALNVNLNSKLNIYVIQDNILNTLKDKERRQTLKEAIVGTDSNKGLLDTSIFQIMNLSSIISSSLNSIPSIKEYVNSVDFNAVLSDLSLLQLKTEFTSMFEVIEKIFDNNDIVDISKLQNIDLTDRKTNSILCDILTSSQKSIVFSSLFPKILKNMLHKNSFDFSDYFFKITPYDFDYESDDFIYAIGSIVSLIPDVNDMKNKIASASSSSLKIQSIDTELVKKILVLITNTDAFNRKATSSATNISSKNLTAYKFLTNLFTSDALKTLNYKKVSSNSISDIYWGTGNGDGGEIDLLIKSIENIKKNPSIFSNSSFLNIEDYDALKVTIDSSLNSYFLKNTILDYINNSLNDYFTAINVPLTIDKMRTSMWINKDSNNQSDIDRLILILKILNNNDLKNFNYLNIEPAELNILLTAFKNSQFISVGVKNESDKFGFVLYSMISSSANKSLATVFSKDNLNSVVNSYSYIEKIKTDYEYKNEKVIYTESGAIKDIVDFFRVVKIVGIENITSGKLPKDSSYKSQIESIQDKSFYKSKFVRIIYKSLLKQAMLNNSFSSSYQNICEYIDFNLLKDMDYIQFEKEIEIFESLSNIDASKFDLMFNNINLLKTNNLYDEFIDLINLISDSKLLTAIKSDKDISPLSYLIFNMSKNNNLLNMSTLLDDENTSALRFKAILNNVDYKTELKSKFLNVIDAMQGFNLTDISFVSSVSLPTYEQSKKLLTSLNESSIYHIVPVYILRKDLTNIGMNELTIDKENNINHEINYYIHLDGNNSDDINYWQNDIDNYLGLIFEDVSFKKTIVDQKIKLSDAVFANDGLNASCMYYLSEMNSLINSRSYIVYNLINKSTLNNNLTSKLFRKSSDAPYNENETVYTIEKLFFDNPTFKIEDKTLRKALKMKELDMLNKPLLIIISSLSKLNNLSSIKELKLTATYEELFSCALIAEESSVYRSKITSEMLASFMTIVKEKMPTMFDSDLNFYNDDYFLINAIEGRALDSLIDYCLLIENKEFLLKEELLPSFKNFGSKIEDNDTKIIKYLVNFYNMLDNRYNAYIIRSKKMLAYITNISVKDKEDNKVILANYIDFESKLNDKTFYEILNEGDIK